MKIAIIGANGQLGSDIVKVLSKENPVLLNHSDIEITDYNSISKIFEQYNPQILINTAAFHNVSQCENQDLKAFTVNALGPKYLAENCLKYNALLLHISTDYVFDGKKRKPYAEDDSPHPLNVYGISKLMGEYYINAIMERYFIVRTSGLYGINKCRGKGGNFIDTMLRLYKEKKEIRVVDDEVLTPTYTWDLANQIKELIKTDNFGLFHVTSHGACSWFEFAKQIFELLNIKVKIKAVKSEEFPSKVKRPAYSVLKNAKLEKLGIDKMRHWKVALKDYLTHFSLTKAK
jgi:dTDP-4-dehydrorhamnose reductase